MKRGIAWLTRTGAIAAAGLCAASLPVLTQDTAQLKASQAHYEKDIAPIFAKNCVGCHSGAQPKGDILLRFKDEDEARAQVANDEFWDKVAAEVESGRMPPATSKMRPSDGERQLLVNWIKNDVLTMNGQPDPGPVIVHRLNNREYAKSSDISGIIRLISMFRVDRLCRHNPLLKIPGPRVQDCQCHP